jgi:hypothetical protein
MTLITLIKHRRGYNIVVKLWRMTMGLEALVVYNQSANCCELWWIVDMPTHIESKEEHMAQGKLVLEEHATQ